MGLFTAGIDIQARQLKRQAWCMLTAQMLTPHYKKLSK
jgi:hypothetical protein